MLDDLGGLPYLIGAVMRLFLGFLWLCFCSFPLFAQGQADLILTKAKFWTASSRSAFGRSDRHQSRSHCSGWKRS